MKTTKMSIDRWMDKEDNSSISDNMGEPWEHYAKWNKSDRKRQIPYDLIIYGI